MTVPTTGPLSSAGALARRGDDVDELVAIDDAAEAVDHHQPIAVTIEGDAGRGAHAGHGELQQSRRGRAAAIVDVAAVGRAADAE